MALINTIIDNITRLDELNNGRSKAKKSNISTLGAEALQSLKDNKSIIVREAGQGGSTVIMDRSYYKEKILELLNDVENYVELSNGNEDEVIQKSIRKLMREHKRELTNEEIDYVQNFEYKTSNFCGLPKIHKSSAVKAAIKEQNTEYVTLEPPTDLKMRPIVAGPCSPTHRLSNLMNLIL